MSDISFLYKVANKLDSLGKRESIFAANAIDMAVDAAMLAHSNGYTDDITSYAILSLDKYASVLKKDGLIAVSTVLNNITKKASDNLLPSTSDRDEKYDYEAHRAESLYLSLEKLPKIERTVEPYLETMKGNAPSLLTRYSPDFPGVNLQRVRDGVYQDVMTRKIYDFTKGFVTELGQEYSGGSTTNQTPLASQYGGYKQVLDRGTVRQRPR